MTDAGGSKVQESQHSPTKPGASQPALIGTEREPQDATWAPYVRGGVAAPPIVPPTLLRSGDAPRGLAAQRADYLHHLQRTHGNQATIRLLKSVPAPTVAAGEARRTPWPAPLGPAPAQRSQDNSRAASNAAIQRESWFEEGAMYLFEQAVAAAGIPVEAVMGLLRRAGSALSRIIDDPGAFLTHLLDALKGGFRQFASNIGKHLQAGLIGWLTGTLGGAGIQLPKQFDLAGIFDLALQILGLTADRIKAKIGQVIGAQNVRRIEGVWKVVSKLISGGLGGLWDMAKEYVGNLYDMVIGQVKEWAITQIVQQAVIQIISMFNPAGALVQVVRTIWNIIQFLRERGAQLFAVFQRITESVAEIAEGNIGNAINAVERTLASAIAPLLGLLARLVGLGDIAERIKQIIEAIRAPIDKALDKVIAVIAKGLKGVIGALGKLIGRGGKPGAEEATAETKAAEERRLQEGVQAGVVAFNRFSGRPVGEQILRPLLTGIRLRYRLAILEPVRQGEQWAVHGEIRRITVPTGVAAGPPLQLVLPVDLNHHENLVSAGQGHAVHKHVGKDEAFLKNRLKTEGNIPAATSFEDGAAANRLVNLLFQQKQADITAWLGATNMNRAFRIGVAPMSAGYGYRRPTANPTDAAAIDAQPRVQFLGLRVVLRKGGPDGWYIVTAHPDDP